MDDHAAIPASEKIQIGFVRLVLRRLMYCGTPKTTKKYDQILLVHFRMAPRYNEHQRTSEVIDRALEQRFLKRWSHHAVDHWLPSAASERLE